MSSLHNNRDTFVHAGIISKITGNSAIITLEENTHCESCHVKGSCGLSKSSTKNVEVHDLNSSFRLNEKGNSYIKKNHRSKGRVLGLCFSFFLNDFDINNKFKFVKRMDSWFIGPFYLDTLFRYTLLFKKQTCSII